MRKAITMRDFITEILPQIENLETDTLETFGAYSGGLNLPAQFYVAVKRPDGTRYEVLIGRNPNYKEK